MSSATKLALAVICSVAWFATGTEASITINNSPAVYYILPFGEPANATFGQTFTVVGNNSVLDSFTFYLDDYQDPDFMDFAFYVAAWDGTKATGPVLYSSPMLTTSNNNGIGGLEQFTISTGGLALNFGTQYVAMISASDFFDSIAGTTAVGQTSNTYSGGSFVYQNNASNFDLLFSESWGGVDVDMAFIAEFSEPSTVPEPLSLLVWAGLASVAGFVKYRRSL